MIRALGVTCILDQFMYGKQIIVPLNFLKFNFLSSGGDYYGTHKWHWYFTQGFTVMIFSHLSLSFVGIIYSKQWKLWALLLGFCHLQCVSSQGIQGFNQIFLSHILHVSMQLAHYFCQIYISSLLFTGLFSESSDFPGSL